MLLTVLPGVQFSGDDAGTGTSYHHFNNAEAGVATGSLFLNNVTGSSEAAGAYFTNTTFDSLHLTICSWLIESKLV